MIETDLDFRCMFSYIMQLSLRRAYYGGPEGQNTTTFQKCSVVLLFFLECSSVLLNVIVLSEMLLCFDLRGLVDLIK